MEKFQGIFDQGFSGIFEDSTKKTMPDFLDKLAEQEIGYEPPVLDEVVIPFTKEMGLSRADELTSRVSRDTNKENRFTVESNQKRADEEKLKQIDKTVEGMLSEGKDFDQMQEHLLDKYPKETVNKYLESKIKLILNKFSFLGFSDLTEKEATLISQVKAENSIKRAFVTDLLKKFSKLEYVSPEIIKEFKCKLDTQRPLKVASSFLFSLNTIKKAFYSENVNDRIAFSRDVDKVIVQESDKKDNNERNSNIAKQNVFATMLAEYKELVCSKLADAEIAKVMSKDFGVEKYQKFAFIYANDMSKIAKFYQRQNFSTNFASLVEEGYEVQSRNRVAKTDTTAMLNFACELMTQGSDFKAVKEAVNNKFGFEAAVSFLGSHGAQLQKHYGQIGYIYIDSNIYASCDEMKQSFAKIIHIGKNLIFNVKANSKCANCTLNKCGECQKVNLSISNSPIVRSPRAAKKVFDKAASFLPKYYVESFVKQIKQADSNMELVSKFALGMNTAKSDEMKNIRKTASNQCATISAEDFVQADGFAIDPFDVENSSKIINDILGKNK